MVIIIIYNIIYMVINIYISTLAIIGIIIIGILSTYMGNNELAAVALGGIVGWISRTYTSTNTGGNNNDP